MKKKLIIGLAVICVLVCLCLAAFWIFGGKAEAPGGNANETPGEGEHDHDHGETPDSCKDGHTTVVDPGREATCTTAGLTEGMHCSVCNKTLMPQLITAALGHDYVNGVCSRCDSRLYSDGLVFTADGKGGCYVSGIGTCKDTEISIPLSNPEGLVVTGIGNEAFLDCVNVTSVKFHKHITNIGDRAFKNCSHLTNVIFPEALTSIGAEAFSGCSQIQTVTIGKSVTSIGKGAFTNCHRVSEVKVEAENTVYRSQGNCLIETASKTLLLGTHKSVIPTDGSVTSIGYGAFWGNWALDGLTIPDSVTSIDDGAFVGCIGLTSIVIPNSVTSIGEYAFLGCTSLKSITLPASLQRISTQLFFSCTALTTVTYQGTTAQWEALDKGNSWNANVPAASVNCSNGSVKVK